MFTVYGIPNCDTTQKALKLLAKNKINYHFHDYKLEGITEKMLQDWCKQKGWETILNKRSTTWRSLSADGQQLITNEKAAIQLMMTAHSIIKRPIITKGNTIVAIGFDEKILSALKN